MQQPNRPVAQPVTLSASRTAVLVLDLSARCENPADPCSQLLPTVASFLRAARQLRAPILFTVSLMHKGTPLGEVAAPLERRPEEPIIYPNAFDKFAGGDLQEFLASRKVENIVIVGSATNIAVMYTATTAIRVYQQYQVVIPLDGVNAHSGYEHEYALHQLSTLPTPPVRPIQFTSFPMLKFT